MHAFITFAATLACVIGVVSASSAATITLEAVSRGSYDDSGVFATGFSGTSAGNYLTGEFSAFGLIRELRSFFVFDLTGINDQIVAGTFDVSAGFYSSVDSSETLSLFDVGSSLTALTNDTGGTSAFADLGSGATYGSRVFTGTEPVLLPPTSIALNAAALAVLNSTSGLFGVGGAVTSITGTSLQVVFGGTGGPDQNSVSRLTLQTASPTAVPEPASLLSLGTGWLGLLAIRAARRRRTRRIP